MQLRYWCILADNVDVSVAKYSTLWKIHMVHTWKNHSQYPGGDVAFRRRVGYGFSDVVRNYPTLQTTRWPFVRIRRKMFKRHTDSDPPGRSSPWTCRNSISRVKAAWIKHVVWHETSQHGAAFTRVWQRLRPTVILRLSVENVDWKFVHAVRIPHAARIVTCFFCRARVKSTETNFGVRKFSQKSRLTRRSQ